MNESTLVKLGKVIGQHWDEKSINARKEINKILHSKSNKTVVKELNNYVNDLKGSQKNVATLIVVLSLLRRNLDCTNELLDLLKKHNLINQLYGGLIQLLSGNSSKITIRIKWNDDLFSNKYEFINRFPAPEYWRYVELFQAVEIISKADINKFEKLSIVDSTNLLLLNLASGSFNVVPSKKLVITLINDEDYLRKNIGFFILVSPIEESVNHSNLNSTQNAELCLIQKTIKILKESDNLTQIDLLVNYFLYNKYARSYLSDFAILLMNKSLQNELIKEISSGHKIKTLEDVKILLCVVKNTPIINNLNKYVSKDSLYRAFIKRIKCFLDNNTGIYNWDANEIHTFTSICNLLPKRYQSILKNYINKELPKLMTTELDELIRFNLFLKDKSKKDILLGMLGIIDTK